MPVIAPPPDRVARRAHLFHGLAEPSRLKILDALADGPRSVSQIAQRAGLTQPNTSNHLACMLGCGLVARERKGRFVFYRLAGEQIETLLRAAAEVVGRPDGGPAECPHCGSRR